MLVKWTQSFRKNVVFLLFFASALIVLVISVLSSILMRDATHMLEQSAEERLLAISRAAALTVTSDELDQFQTIQDMEGALYAEVKERLMAFSGQNGVLFTYYMRPVAEGFQFVVDSDIDPETLVGLGTEPVASEPAPEIAMGGTAATSGVGTYSEAWDGLLSAWAPVYDGEGRVAYLAGVDMQDEQIITARNNMMMQAVFLVASMVVVLITGSWAVYLYRKKAELSESANVAKSEFLSRMSHEIRTPMNAIIGLCRMARETEDRNELHTHLENIDRSSGHLLSLVNDILDISKIESGKMALHLAPVSVKSELDRIRVLVAPQVTAKGQHFVIECDPAIPDALMADGTHVRQIMVNLLSNAVKFTPEGGQVRLAIKLLERRGSRNHLQWCVVDTGIGIAPEFIGRLFDPFEQEDGSTTRKFGGSGLGLAITKQFVEMMGGTIQVESKLGEGSSFIFELWLEDAASADVQAEETSDSDTPVDLTGQRVLLVEDVEINQLIAENVIAGMGAEVVVAENGRVGVDLFLKAPASYQFIFMDIQMPVMDGYEATRAIRASGVPEAAHVPVIAMTANVFQEDVDRAYEAGMNGYVGKPFDVEQVKNAIRKVRHAQGEEKGRA